MSLENNSEYSHLFALNMCRDMLYSRRSVHRSPNVISILAHGNSRLRSPCHLAHRCLLTSVILHTHAVVFHALFVI